MTINRVEIESKGPDIKFVLWVESINAWGVLKDRPYVFKFQNNDVFFMVGGWGAKDKDQQLIGHATSLNEAQRLIENWWLKE